MFALVMNMTTDSKMRVVSCAEPRSYIDYHQLRSCISESRGIGDAEMVYRKGLDPSGF